MSKQSLYVTPSLSLDSEVARLVIELEHLRKKYLTGTTPPWVFFGLKNLFQTIESVTSARIEGNKTTIAGFVEAARNGDTTIRDEEDIKIILNVENGIKYIESLAAKGIIIDQDFILALHRIVVEGLDPMREGDVRPGAYRTDFRKISKSEHVLPAPADVKELMAGLIEFINQPMAHQMDLIKIAMVHHRFVWIHPFGNGNGRVVRLLTYAMLAKAGYIDEDGARLLDPTAVFGLNKFRYYDMLAGADDLSEDGLTKWCEYMLAGLNEEARKIDNLLDGDFTKRRIIIPAIAYSLEKQRISKLEHDMLLVCVEKDIVSAADFRHLFSPQISNVNISHAIGKLRQQNLLEPEHPSARKYHLCMNRNPLTIGIIKQLDDNGFLPPMDSHTDDIRGKTA